MKCMLNYVNFGKRLFDFLCSTVGLAVLSPLLLLVSIMIKMDSPGPVFFLQERIGKGGKGFMLIKFRSMHSDPDREKREFTPGDKMRITRLGKIIRKTKIDELPELINVFKGDMSLVGPRPEVPVYSYYYMKREFKPILSLRPGITDWASIKYRSEEEELARSSDPDKLYKEEILPEKLFLNLTYLKKISLMTDIKIILYTLIRILMPDNHFGNYNFG